MIKKSSSNIESDTKWDIGEKVRTSIRMLHKISCLYKWIFKVFFSQACNTTVIMFGNDPLGRIFWIELYNSTLVPVIIKV